MYHHRSKIGQYFSEIHGKVYKHCNTNNKIKHLQHFQENFLRIKGQHYINHHQNPFTLYSTEEELVETFSHFLLNEM